jgi:hypothetical protein
LPLYALHCERATRSVTTAAIPIIRTTDKQNLLPLHTVIAENLSAAISFAPIRPSLRESNAKRYDRGNPNHKNDGQTKSFAPTHCYCRKKPTGPIFFAPIRPSLRESNAKRYERGNPIHKNDGHTVLSFRLEVFRHLFSHSASLSALTSTFGFSAMTTGQLFLHFASLSVLTSKKGF